MEQISNTILYIDHRLVGVSRARKFRSRTRPKWWFPIAYARGVRPDPADARRRAINQNGFGPRPRLYI